MFDDIAPGLPNRIWWGSGSCETAVWAGSAESARG